MELLKSLQNVDVVICVSGLLIMVLAIVGKVSIKGWSFDPKAYQRVLLSVVGIAAFALGVLPRFLDVLPERAADWPSGRRAAMTGVLTSTPQEIEVPPNSFLVASASAASSWDETPSPRRTYLQVEILNGGDPVAADRSYTSDRVSSAEQNAPRFQSLLNPDLKVSASVVLGPGNYSLSAVASGGGIRPARPIPQAHYAVVMQLKPPSE